MAAEWNYLPWKDFEKIHQNYFTEAFSYNLTFLSVRPLSEEKQVIFKTQ